MPHSLTNYHPFLDCVCSARIVSFSFASLPLLQLTVEYVHGLLDLPFSQYPLGSLLDGLMKADFIRQFWTEMRSTKGIFHIILEILAFQYYASDMIVTLTSSFNTNRCSRDPIAPSSPILLEAHMKTTPRSPADRNVENFCVHSCFDIPS